jgi:putative DNA primase/helicase
MEPSTSLHHPAGPDDSKSSASDFLRQLYGHDAPGWLTIWTLPDKVTAWFPAHKLDEAAAYALRLADTHDVYFGVGLRQKKLDDGRGTVKDVLAIPGLWMDFDIQHPVHKRQHLPPSLDDVLHLIEVIPQRPSILVHSGYGVHAYWLFRELWWLEDPTEHHRAAHLLRRLQMTFKAAAKQRGWDLDSTFSLDHVLRLPGTLNHKCPDDPQRPYVMGGQP